MESMINQDIESQAITQPCKQTSEHLLDNFNQDISVQTTLSGLELSSTIQNEPIR